MNDPKKSSKSKAKEEEVNLLELLETHSNSKKKSAPTEETNLQILSPLESDSERIPLQIQNQTIQVSMTPNFAVVEEPEIPEEKRYEKIKTLGEGGMGVVELVKDHLLGREVARKTIKINPQQAKNFSKQQAILYWRFKKEASITAILEHPNIIPLYEMQRKKGAELQFTMRKVEGETFRDLLNQQRNKKNHENETRFLNIFLKVCDAIAYAHSKGVIHRDLKPENIMVGKFGEVYVMDWGIAKQLAVQEELLEEIIPSQEEISPKITTKKISMVSENVMKTVGGLGTKGYMSPEQAEKASNVTPASDIFALGKILRECFTGYSPHEEFQLELKLFQTQQKQNPSKKENLQSKLDQQVPLEVQAIVQKATQEEAKNRYRSVMEMTSDIESYQKNLKVSAKEYGLLETLLKWVKRNRQKISISAFVLTLCVTFIFYIFWKEKQVKTQQFLNAQQDAQTSLILAKQEKSTKITPNETTVGHLLNAFNSINSALLLKPGDEKIEQKTFEIAQELIILCCETKDYQLAEVIAKQTNLLSKIPESEKKILPAKIKESRNATTRKHLERLKTIEIKFKTQEQKENDLENALFEIVKMQEEEVLQQLITLLEEGTKYMITHSIRNPKLVAFYQMIIDAIGRLENPTAGIHLIQALDGMFSQKIVHYPRDKEIPLDESNYMVTLAVAFKNVNDLQYANEFCRIYEQMQWKKSTFASRTESISQEMIQATIHLYSNKDKSSGAMDYMLQGILHLNNKEYDQAIAYFSKVIHQNPDALDAYFSRGSAKCSKKDFEGALHDFEKVLQLHPQDPKILSKVYNHYGAIKIEKNDFEGALSDFSEAIQFDPTDVRIYQNRAFLYELQNKFEEAEKDYTYIIQQNSQHEITYFLRGCVREKQGNIDGALSDYSEMIQINPDFVKAYHNRGNLKKRKDDIEGALSDYSQAIQINPQLVESYYARGTIKGDRGDIDGAISDYSEAIRINPQLVDPYVNRGLQKYYKQDFEGAISDYNQAIQVNPKLAIPYNNRGLVKLAKGDLQGAFNDYEEAIRLDPQLALPYNNRALIKQDKGKIEEALIDFTKAIQLDPCFVDAYYHRGILKISKSDFENAINDFSEVIRLNPKYVNAYNDRGWCKYLLKRWSEAIQDFDQAIFLNSLFTLAYFNRGLAKSELSDFNGAIQDFSSILKINPALYNAYFYRGLVYKKKTDLQKAKQDFKLFLETSKNSTDPQIKTWRQQILQEFPDLKQ